MKLLLNSYLKKIQIKKCIILNKIELNTTKNYFIKTKKKTKFRCKYLINNYLYHIKSKNYSLKNNNINNITLNQLLLNSYKNIENINSFMLDLKSCLNKDTNEFWNISSCKSYTINNSEDSNNFLLNKSFNNNINYFVKNKIDFYLRILDNLTINKFDKAINIKLFNNNYKLNLIKSIKYIQTFYESFLSYTNLFIDYIINIYSSLLDTLINNNKIVNIKVNIDNNNYNYYNNYITIIEYLYFSIINFLNSKYVTEINNSFKIDYMNILNRIRGLSEESIINTNEQINLLFSKLEEYFVIKLIYLPYKLVDLHKIDNNNKEIISIYKIFNSYNTYNNVIIDTVNRYILSLNNNIYNNSYKNFNNIFELFINGSSISNKLFTTKQKKIYCDILIENYSQGDKFFNYSNEYILQQIFVLCKLSYSNKTNCLMSHIFNDFIENKIFPYIKNCKNNFDIKQNSFDLNIDKNMFLTCLNKVLVKGSLRTQNINTVCFILKHYIDIDIYNLYLFIKIANNIINNTSMHVHNLKHKYDILEVLSFIYEQCNIKLYEILLDNYLLMKDILDDNIIELKNTNKNFYDNFLRISQDNKLFENNIKENSFNSILIDKVIKPNLDKIEKNAKIVFKKQEFNSQNIKLFDLDSLPVTNIINYIRQLVLLKIICSLHLTNSKIIDIDYSNGVFSLNNTDKSKVSYIKIEKGTNKDKLLYVCYFLESKYLI